MAGPTPPLDSARLAQRRPMFRRITPRSTNKQAPPSHTSERVQELAESWRSYRNDIEQEKVQKAVQRRKREVLKRLLTKEAAAKGIEATAFSLLGVPVTEERVEEKPGDDTPKQSRRPVYLPIELSVLNKRVRLNDDDAAHSQGELASDCISRESGAQSARPPTLRSSRANIRRDSEPSLQSARELLRHDGKRRISAGEMQRFLSTILLGDSAMTSSRFKKKKNIPTEKPPQSRQSVRTPALPLEKMRPALRRSSFEGPVSQKATRDSTARKAVDAELMAKHPSLRTESRRVIETMERLNSHVLIEVNPLVEPPSTAAAMRKTLSAKAEHYFDAGFHAAVEGSLDTAIREFRRALRFYPDHPIVLYNLATLFIFRCDYVEAIRIFARLIMMLCNNGLAEEVSQKERGETMKSLSPKGSPRSPRRGAAIEGEAPFGSKDDATAPLQPKILATKVDPTKKVDVLSLKENLSFSIHVFISRIFNNRGLCYHHLYHYREAIADFSRAMYYDSENVLALRNRGMSYRQAKSYTASIADYVRANSMEPDYEDWVQSARERRQELALDRGGGASEFAPSMNEEEMAGSSFLYKQLLQDEQVSVRREQSSLTERSSSKTSRSPPPSYRIIRTSSHLSPLVVGDDSKDLEIAQIEREEEAQELRELREREEISEEIQGASIKKGLSLNAALTVASSVVRFKQKLKNRITSSSPTSTFIAPETEGSSNERLSVDRESPTPQSTDLPAGLAVTETPELTDGERSRKLLRRLSMRVIDSPTFRRSGTPDYMSNNTNSPQSPRSSVRKRTRSGFFAKFSLSNRDEVEDFDEELEAMQAAEQQAEQMKQEELKKELEELKAVYLSSSDPDQTLIERIKEIKGDETMPLLKKEEAIAKEVDCRAEIDPDVQTPLLFANIDEGTGARNYRRILNRHFELALMKANRFRTERDQRVIDRWLAFSDFLNHHSLPVRRDICKRMRLERLDAGTFLFRKGDIRPSNSHYRAHDFYFILSGAVTVERKSTTSDAVVVLKTLVDGQAFGFASLYSNHYCPNDEELEDIVRSRSTKSKKASLMKGKELLAASPSFGSAMRTRAASRVKALTRKVVEKPKAPIRNATVRIYEDSVLLAVSHDDYVSVLAQYDLASLYREDIYEKLRALRGFTIFLSWSHDDLVKLASVIHIHHLKMDRIALDAGEKPGSLFFIKSGTCYMLYPRAQKALLRSPQRRNAADVTEAMTGRSKNAEDDRTQLLARFHQPSKALFQAMTENKAYQSLTKKEKEKAEQLSSSEDKALFSTASPTSDDGRHSSLSNASRLSMDELYKKDEDNGRSFDEIMTLQAGSVFGLDPHLYFLAQDSKKEQTERQGEDELIEVAGGKQRQQQLRTPHRKISLDRAIASISDPSPVRIKTDTHVELLELPLQELWRLGEKTALSVHERHPLVVMDLKKHLGERARWAKEKRDIVSRSLAPNSKSLVTGRRNRNGGGL